MPPWQTIVWLVLAFGLLVPLTRWFSKRVQSLFLLLTGHSDTAIYAHFVLLLPGVLLHEASHWLSATLLGVHTGKVSLRPKPTRGGSVRLGALQFRRTGMVRESIVGLAPLAAGTIVVLLIAHGHFGLDISGPWRLDQLRGQLPAASRASDAWLWVYLIVAVSNAMRSSASDRSSWRPLALYLVVLILALYLLGALSRVPAQIVDLGVSLSRHLALAFSLSAGLDLAIGCGLWATERLLGLLIGRRVEAK